MYQKRTAPFLFLCCLFVAAATYAREPITVRVEASAEFLELIKTWDKDIWFFTPQDKPIRSLNGLTGNDIAC